MLDLFHTYWPHILFVFSLVAGTAAAIHAAMTKEEVRSAIGWVGIISGPLIIFGALEGAGVEIAWLVNVIGYALCSLFLIATGISLLLAKPQSKPQVQAALVPAPAASH